MTVAMTGLICNGRHLQTLGWEEIVWGKPPLLGQLPKLIHVYLEEQKERHVAKIVFGTGASKHISQFETELEAEYMARYMFDHMYELIKFPQFVRLTSRDIARLVTDIAAILEIDTTSKNTYEECASALKSFARAGVTRVLAVTCPTHAPRCMRDLLRAAEELHPSYSFADGIFLTPSDVSFAGQSAQNIVVIEPPHRGDTPQSFTEFHQATQKLLSTFLQLNETQRAQFVEEINTICSTHLA